MREKKSEIDYFILLMKWVAFCRLKCNQFDDVLFSGSLLTLNLSHAVIYGKQ